MTIDFFGLPEHLEARPADPTTPDQAAELAWMLRQRDTARALALAERAQAGGAALSPALAARSTLLRAEARWLAADSDGAVALIEQARQGFADDAVGLGDCALIEATLADQRGEDSVPLLQRAAAHFAAAGDALRCHLVSTWRACRDVGRGPAAAAERWHEPLQAALACGHPGLDLFVHAFRALVAYHGADVAGALVAFQQAHAAALRCGQRWWAITLAQNIGIAYSTLNDHADALAWLERAHDEVCGTGWPYATGWCLGQRAAVLEGLNRHAEARDLLREALAVLAPFPLSRNFALASQALGEVLLALTQDDAAAEALAAAERSARHLGAADLVAGTLRFKAVLLSRRGQIQDALAAADEAVTLARGQGDLRRLSTTLHARAQIARAHGLPAPTGSDAPNGAIHHLQQALQAGAGMAGFIAPAAWHHELSADFEAVGDLAQALAHARLASAAFDRAREREAQDLATALRVRHETERALQEAAHQQALAQASEQRARTMEHLAEVKAQLERERAQTLLAHAGKLMALGRLATGVVHEMSHPVGTLLMLAESLQAAADTGPAARIAPGLAREARRLQRLTQRLRDFARPSPLQITRLRLPDVVADARALVAPRLHLQHIRYRDEVPDLVVLADAERLGLALANLLFNAADALAGHPAAEIQVQARAEVGQVRLSVQDNGPGLSPAVRQRLFEPFFTTKPEGEGLGLGLALSAESLAAMQGRIDCVDSDGPGACFVIVLPEATAATSSGSPPAADPAP